MTTRAWVALGFPLWCACDLMQMTRDRDTVKALTPAPLAKPANARSACERALKLDGSLGRAHYLLAALDEQSGRKGDAITHLEKAIVTDAPNADAWHRLARLYRGYRMTSAVDALAPKYQKRFGKPLPP